MNPGRAQRWGQRGRRWLPAAIAGVVVVAAGLLLIRGLDPVPARGPAVAPAPVRLARSAEADGFLRDEASIRDLRPLFLPTPVNARAPEPRREAGRSLLDEDPVRLTYGEGEAGLLPQLPPVATLGGRAVERAEARLTLEPDGTAVAPVGFGRAEPRVVPEAARGGLLEVIAAGTGERVLAMELPEALAPPAGKPWEPLELVAIVDVAGLAGPLVVTESSRVEEVDVHFRRQLRQVFRLGERLAPGVYRVVVGP
ncbi:MAG: hypothetical protein ACO3G4_12995 [Opitutaceae bacterium]